MAELSVETTTLLARFVELPATDTDDVAPRGQCINLDRLAATMIHYRGRVPRAEVIQMVADAASGLARHGVVVTVHTTPLPPLLVESELLREIITRRLPRREASSD